jgi:hypothetical protein
MLTEKVHQVMLISTQNGRAPTFPGNPYDGHTLAAQFVQTRIFLENVATESKVNIVKD